jgi:hypothetical protein
LVSTTTPHPTPQYEHAVRVLVVVADVSAIATDDYGGAFHLIDNDVRAVSRLAHVRGQFRVRRRNEQVSARIARRAW